MEKLPLEISASDIRRSYLKPLEDKSLSIRAFNDNSSRPRSDGQFQRDYARVMYSSSFRRLQGKMQLLSINNDQFFRNRLTHSLEVSQIAKSIATTLGYDISEIYVVEAGALAHDLGNPPFGHSGEKLLNSKFAEIGGFEGNAQTMRILTNLEKKRASFRGLNLTNRTLLSVVKYFNKYDIAKANEKQKFIYDDDYDYINRLITDNSIILRTLDVQIVDIADEIAYAAHDLEDGLRIKAFTIEEILQDYQAIYGKTNNFDVLQGTVEAAKVNAGFGDSKISSTEFSKLFRQELSSMLINLFVSDIDMMDVSEEYANKKYTKQKQELQFIKYGELVSGLKDIVFKCINNKDGVYLYEQRGDEILSKLSDIYMEKPTFLPPEYRANDLINQYTDLKDVDLEKLQKRLVCDYVAGMMDSYAISSYERHTGKKFLGGR